MPLYNPANDCPASPGELAAMFNEWQAWLYDTGQPADANAQAPFGFDVPTGGTIFDPDAVPIAASGDVFRRYFSGTETQYLHFVVPRAAGVLGLSDRLAMTYRAAFLPAKDLQSAPGDYAPATCLLTVTSPAVEGIDLRSYRLIKPHSVGGLIEGQRHDRLAATRTVAVDPETGQPPRIAATEQMVLADLGQACMMLFASERETAREPKR